MSDDSRIRRDLREVHTRFIALVEPFRSELHRYCARMIGSVLDGEDLVQEVLAQACYRLPLLGDDIPLRRWLFTIAHHRCVDFLRSRAASRLVIDVDVDAADTAITVEDDMSFEDRDLASRAFSSVVLELPPRERAAVILKELLGYSLLEIAAIQEISLGAVKAALHRGRDKLAVATDLAEVAPKPPPPPHAARYVEAFNRRDWNALIALLDDDVDVELVGHVRHRGRSAVADNYLESYAELPFSWRMVFAEVDDEPVLVCLRADGDTWLPRHALRLEWRGDRVVRIRDYAHVPYVLGDARLVVHDSRGLRALRSSL